MRTKGGASMQDKKKILMVDDDELHLYMAKELLQNEHVEVFAHRSGFGVTNLVRALKPDLVLLDVNMPALSGDRLATLLATNHDISKIPIVFYSSNDEESLREIAANCGVSGYVCKGNIAALRKKVGQYLYEPLKKDVTVN
jgi:two-component system OmpR family response regulator